MEVSWMRGERAAAQYVRHSWCKSGEGCCAVLKVHVGEWLVVRCTVTEGPQLGTHIHTYIHGWQERGGVEWVGGMHDTPLSSFIKAERAACQLASYHTFIAAPMLLC